MATESASSGFGRVSRLRGALFEYLSLSASVVGIFMLAILLVYVFIDAFSLSTAAPEWLLTYYLTLVVPIIVFCLYSADSKELTRKIVFALVGGLVGTIAVFNGFEAVIQSVPRINWQLAYMFAIVVPTTGVAIFAGSRQPVGKVGFGLVGRLLGGTGLGFGLIILFLVFKPRLWFWVYTLGVLPAFGVLAYGSARPQTPVSLFVAPVALAGFLAATNPTSPFWFGIYLGALSLPVLFVIEQLTTDSEANTTVLVAALAVGAVLTLAVNILGFAPEYILLAYASYPITWLIYVWTLAIPVSLIIGTVIARQTSRETGRNTVIATLAVGLIGSQAGTVIGITPPNALLFLLTTGVPAVAYTLRVLETSEGAVGLSLPLLAAAGILIGAVFVDTMAITAPDPWLDASFAQDVYSQTPERAGFYPAVVGSVVIVAMVALFSFVLGVGTAVLLEEYMPDSGLLGKLTRLIQINIANLAAVPSIVYGLLGLGVLINGLGFGLGVGITAALTLSLLILPITIISAQEAIRSVPDDMRRGSYAMGATRWQTTKNVVLPQALPGIFTGTILSLGRAIGETAPLIMIGAPHVVFTAPSSIFDKMTAMPMQIFIFSGFPQEAFRTGVLSASVITLLVVLLGLNGTAIILRNRYERNS